MEWYVIFESVYQFTKEVVNAEFN